MKMDERMDGVGRTDDGGWMEAGWMNGQKGGSWVM